jgi:predicted nucleic acid-binding protein
VRFLDALEGSPRVRVELARPEVEERALGWLRQHDERACSFVDATSFTMMRTLQIGDALGYDGDFSAAGFVELR